MSIPNETICDEFIKKYVEKNKKILDLGCSFGRMNEMLYKYSNNIYGVDPDSYALSMASNLNYVELKVGFAESIPYKKKQFSFILCWAVFDIVDHVQGIKEMNRVLKKNGIAVLTGKMSNYCMDDENAWIAEKNAYLKNFPNKFTLLNETITSLHLFGFELLDLKIFKKEEI